jgi:hypothetical protein
LHTALSDCYVEYRLVANAEPSRHRLVAPRR